MQTKGRALLQPASAAVILGSDWIVAALSWFYELELLSGAALWGSVFCAISVFLVENVARPIAPGAAFWRAALAGAIVLAPTHVLGTVIALSALVWSALLYLAELSQRWRR